MIEISNNQIAAQWDANAQTRLQELEHNQDRTYSNVLCNVLGKLAKTVPHPERILDVGCGLGFFADRIQRATGADVYAVDISRQSIAIASARFRNVKFRDCNIASIETWLQVETLDICFANMVFHNVLDFSESLEAIFNALKPGGVLLAAIPNPDVWFPRRVNRLHPIAEGCGTVYNAPFKIRNGDLHPSMFTYFHRSLDEYNRHFRDAGFSKIESISVEDRQDIPDDLLFFRVIR